LNSNYLHLSIANKPKKKSVVFFYKIRIKYFTLKPKIDPNLLFHSLATSTAMEAADFYELEMTHSRPTLGVKKQLDKKSVISIIKPI
jgi:hypothetical protein